MLLVEPNYRRASRSKHEAKLCPVGLFRHYFFHLERGDDVSLVRGCVLVSEEPDVVKVSSLFTYWSKDVFRAVKYYSELFPGATVMVGGVLASLVPEVVRDRFPGVVVHEGVDREAENARIDWSRLGRSVQIIHASRGCIRSCKFCGVGKIEPDISYKSWDEVKSEVQLNDVVFFDNNFLMNPFHEEILEGLARLRVGGRVVRCEAQSGFDPRLLTPRTARMLKKARFRSVRISWDHGLEQAGVVRRALKCLVDAGFNSKSVGVFMIYNWDLPFPVLEQKRLVCRDWNVQIFDCRYRPLDQLFDDYDPRKTSQTSNDYFIHPAWTDAEIRKFRRNVRRQNIVIRFNFRDEQQLDEWLRNKKRTGRLTKRNLTLKIDSQKSFLVEGFNQDVEASR